jgi:uncharacterized protein YndB with AHSA1/START domain
MALPNSSESGTTDREILVSRVFAAPRELVWQAMIDPKHVVHWWGPHGFTTTIEEMDVRPGGAWKHTMRGPDGTSYPNHSIFREVVKPERIVYTHGGRREGGPGVGFVATWSFEALGAAATRVTLRMVFPSAEDREFAVRTFGAHEGAKQTLARLAERFALPPGASPPFVLTREFSAPRAVVWRAWTEAEHLSQWFGPKGFTIPTAKLDFRPDGIFHFCMKTPAGDEMWARWRFLEITAPDRLVWINSFSNPAGEVVPPPFPDPWPAEILNTVTFTEHAGQTTVSIHSVAFNAPVTEQRTFDENHESMHGGWGGTFEQLAAHLPKI